MNRFKRILILLENAPHLLDLLFDRTALDAQSDYGCSIRVCGTEQEIEEQIGTLSHGEKLLVKIAVSIWNGDARVNLEEIMSVLDASNYQNFIRAMVGEDHHVEITRGW